MKKIGFVMQVLTIIIALPLLTVLEINHVNQKVADKKTHNYVIVPAEKTASIDAAATGKMPS